MRKLLAETAEGRIEIWPDGMVEIHKKNGNGCGMKLDAWVDAGMESLKKDKDTLWLASDSPPT